MLDDESMQDIYNGINLLFNHLIYLEKIGKFLDKEALNSLS